VDGHIDRVPRRLGFVPEDTDDVEFALMQIVPKGDWLRLSELLVALGQNHCVGVSPKCSECPLTKTCPRIGVGKSR
jgi:endonuclease-3